MASDLKSVVERLSFRDDAQVQKQLVDQILRVKLRLARVRRKVLVLSGKGGVGKSTVTAQLALALARRGLKVGVFDADLNGPCIPRMLGLSGRRLALSPGGAVPPVGPLGVKVASMGFLTEPGLPVRWKGPMDLTPVWLGMLETGVIREFLSDVDWGELDLLLFDLPPGAAADKPPTLANLLPELDGAVVVTTSSLVVVEVVRRSAAYARDLGIPLLGLVENMAARGAGSRSSVQGAIVSGDRVQDLAREFEMPLLARLPSDPELSEASDRGEPLPEGHPLSLAFDELGGRLLDRLGEARS